MKKFISFTSDVKAAIIKAASNNNINSNGMAADHKTIAVHVADILAGYGVILKHAPELSPRGYMDEFSSLYIYYY